jgi:hypothetical protein
MRWNFMAVFFLTAGVLTACNKSSPPPQKPVTPRSIAAIELPLRFTAP